MNPLARLFHLALAATVILTAHAEGAEKLNVLHIISDDLAARLHCYGDPLVQSPNIDRLAARGVRFEHAYCQFPLCNPSRASFLSGRRPDVTKVYENRTDFRTVIPNATTLPQSFRKAGYHVARVGKLYHYGVPSQIGTDGLDDPASWEKVVNPKGRDVDEYPLINRIASSPDGNGTITVKAKALTELGGQLSWLAQEGTDAEQTDGKIAAEAVDLLEGYAKSGEPFYLAVGFFRPHTPYVAPKPYFALYPLDQIQLPRIPSDLASLFPAPALATQKKEQTAMSDDLRRQAIQAYHAATTFMDAQVGTVLGALDRLKLTGKTVVVFHSDHGYHLGEKNLWQKMSIFEESARVPLIIATPDRKEGQTSSRTVELVSLHKTLTDLCGVPADPEAQGYSLKPLLTNPKAEWKYPAFSQVSRGGSVGTNAPAEAQGKKKGNAVMGRSVRTERWRYTEWNEGSAGAELYDHDNDPGEYRNLAADPGSAATVAELQALLRAGGK